jgi:hypothetical protein
LNVLKYELQSSEYVRIARYLAGVFAGHYLAVDDDGQVWRLILNVSPAGALNITRFIGTTTSWTVLAAFGIIEPD